MPELDHNSLPQACSAYERRIELAQHWNQKVNAVVHFVIGFLFLFGILVLLYDAYNWLQQKTISWVSADQLLTIVGLDSGIIYSLEGWDAVISFLEILLNLPLAPSMLVCAFVIAPITDVIFTFNVKKLEADLKKAIAEENS